MDDRGHIAHVSSAIRSKRKIIKVPNMSTREMSRFRDELSKIPALEGTIITNKKIEIMPFPRDVRKGIGKIPEQKPEPRQINMLDSTKPDIKTRRGPKPNKEYIIPRDSFNGWQYIFVFPLLTLFVIFLYTIINS